MPVFPPANEIWPLLKRTFNDWLEDKAPKLAASLALYAMLSLAPMLVIFLKVVGIVFRDETDKVESFMQGVMPGAGAQAVEEMIRNASQPGGGVFATTISVVIAAFGATGVFGELQDSMNTIWEVKPKPGRGIWGFIRTRFLSLAMVLGLAFLLTQLVEYAHVGFNTGDGAFASVFFGLTGLHGAHVAVGLSLLTISAVRAFKGHFSAEHHHGVEIPGIYWHFVDVMWIIVFFAVYIL